MIIDPENGEFIGVRGTQLESEPHGIQKGMVNRYTSVQTSIVDTMGFSTPAVE